MVPKMNQFIIIITHLVKWSVSLSKLFFPCFPIPITLETEIVSIWYRKIYFFLTQVYVNYATNYKNRTLRNLFYLNTVCDFNTRNLAVCCCSNHVLSRIKYLGGHARITRSAFITESKQSNFQKQVTSTNIFEIQFSTECQTLLPPHSAKRIEFILHLSSWSRRFITLQFPPGPKGSIFCTWNYSSHIFIVLWASVIRKSQIDKQVMFYKIQSLIFVLWHSE